MFAKRLKQILEHIPDDTRILIPREYGWSNARTLEIKTMVESSNREDEGRYTKRDEWVDDAQFHPDNEIKPMAFFKLPDEPPKRPQTAAEKRGAIRRLMDQLNAEREEGVQS